MTVGETSYCIAKRSLRHIPYLSTDMHPDLEPNFLLAVARKFQLSVFSRLEPIPVLNLGVVDCGVCAKNGHVLLAGNCFGLDMLLVNTLLDGFGCARAYTQIKMKLVHGRQKCST